jgi:hypothetical protein
MPWMIRRTHRILARAGIVGALVLTVAAAVCAQEPAPEPPQSQSPGDDQPAAADASPDSKNRIFGVMPNYTTVEGFGKVEPITTAQSFKMAALDSFDPFVYPLFGFIAATAQVQNEPASWGHDWPGYAKRYGLAFADNTMCSLITTGLMPSLLKQDPRYYQGRATGFFPRLAYAASRSVVTKSRTGHPQFNLSEIGGTLIVAGVSNAYYPPEERNRNATLERWGTQAMWDTVANELKEFWPDMRRMLHGL